VTGTLEREVIGLGYLGVTSPDLAAWETLSTELLGLQLGSSPVGHLSIRVDQRPFRIRVHEGADAGLRYVGWEVANMANLGTLVTRLMASGMKVREASRDEARERCVDALFVTEDPAGSRVEFFAGPAENTRDVFRSSRGITFRTGDQGLGHIVLLTPNFDEMVRFYLEDLRFGATDMRRVPRDMYFLGCNERHHSIALLRGEGTSMLHHFMLEAETLVDVGQAYDLCEAAGIVTTTLGAHANDRMTSFYLRTPAGFEIEFGHGGVTINDRTSWSAPVHEGPTSLWGHRRLPAGQA
jgi:2,3-dihydroxybiphenyl 1,2-dioxygenase